MNLKLIIGIIFLGLILSCEKNKNCEISNPACAEVPPTNELCDAYFTRWFYNEATNTCEQISYSGCNVYGFATKEECESCGCK